MRTAIGSIVMETNGYDILAELDTQNDTSGLREYLLKRKQEAAEKAQQYLSENPKEFCYRAIGYPTDIPWDEEPELDYCCLMRYTDQEVARIKELIVEMWNKYSGPEGQLQSYEELCPTADLRDLQDVNAELDQLLWDKAEESDFALRCIDFNQPLHAYLFSTYEYDTRKQEMCSHRHYHRVILTDEEYLFLLTEQLNNRDFTFNHLLLCRPELAKKICAATADKDLMSISVNPYIIIMDELQSDMEKILGHEPLHEMLCSCNTDGYSYVVNVYVENDELSLNWQRVKDDDFSLDSLCEGNTKGIDAKAVMQLMGAKDYYEMMDRISERFSGKDAYENLLEYLNQNGVSI